MTDIEKSIEAPRRQAWTMFAAAALQGLIVAEEAK